jgi:hypothetical protein
VQQFFEHGGEQLYIVRVANNARGAMLCLPAAGSALILRALEPGSSERIRAAVDYDGLDEDNDELFNLTLQRVDPANGFIIDQEIFKRLSFKEEAETFVADLLASSSMAEVEHPYPTHRPELTSSNDSRYDLSWIEHAQDGTDGTELSDYDLIGSRQDGTGIFALLQTRHFDALYLPPPGKNRDTGPAAVLAAEMFCRERGAMLITDPASEWQTAADVLDGMRQLGVASPNMLSYFPRVIDSSDREGAERAAGAALAGLMCKLDASFGPWQSLEHESLGFKRSLQPSCTLDEEDRYALLRAGINVLERGAGRRTRIAGSKTLARGSESYREFKDLAVRRLCLRILSTIDNATRWAVFEKPDQQLTRRIRFQVLDYFRRLAELGAFANEQFVVECDAGLCKRTDRLLHGVTILLVFHPIGSADPLSFTIHQTVAGCRVTTTAFAPVADICA